MAAPRRCRQMRYRRMFRPEATREVQLRSSRRPKPSRPQPTPRTPYPSRAHPPYADACCQCGCAIGQGQKREQWAACYLKEAPKLRSFWHLKRCPCRAPHQRVSEAANCQPAQSQREYRRSERPRCSCGTHAWWALTPELGGAGAARSVRTASGGPASAGTNSQGP